LVPFRRAAWGACRVVWVTLLKQTGMLRIPVGYLSSQRVWSKQGGPPASREPGVL